MSVELLNVDCMEYMRGQPDSAFDLAVVDPPYGIGAGKASHGMSASSRLEKKDWDKETPSDEYFSLLFRVAKEQIIWGGNYFRLRPSRGYVIWDKGSGFQGRSYAECELAWLSMDCNARIYRRDPLAFQDYVGKIHPTQKPVPLYEWLLRNYAKPGQRILDTHLGSGSSAIAAHYYDVDFVGCEIDVDYYLAATTRFDAATRQLALFG